MADPEKNDLGPDMFRQVQESYSRVAQEGQGLDRNLRAEALIMGYSEDDLADAQLMGLGCGNPVGFADLKPGEVVLDLGCGGGFDCFLAGKKVGSSGKVIGVDMTAEMVRTARAEVKRQPQSNHVSFRLGEIEHLPVADKEVDVIISNGVVCLSLDLSQVFHEAFRALKLGGRMAICDMVQMQALPDELKTAQAFSS